MRVIRAEQLTRAGNNTNADLEQHCTHTATCEVAGVTMQLRTDIPEVARLFALRYADHPARNEPDFCYYVATVRGGYAFWCAHAATWRWTQGPLPPEAVAFLADSVALAAIIRYDPALVSMLAACVEHNGVAAALAGHSVAGKTATLLACARRGMHIYSDERTVLRNSIAYPYLRRSSVRAAGARLLLADTGDLREEEAYSRPQTLAENVFRKRGDCAASQAAIAFRHYGNRLLRRAGSDGHRRRNACRNALLRCARRHGRSRDARDDDSQRRAVLSLDARYTRRNVRCDGVCDDAHSTAPVARLTRSSGRCGVRPSRGLRAK